MSDPAPTTERPPFRLRDHVGVLAAVVLGVLAVVGLFIMAIAGVSAARTMLIVPAVVIFLIAAGSWMRR
jgi:drug/metabolite transporter (DMT)-like permease